MRAGFARVANGAVGVPAHNVAHECLGNVAVHRVHGHVIGVVGAPAERNFGEVTRADNDSAFAVRDVHQYLRALAGLHVLVSHVEFLRVVPDVGKMLEACLLDIDGTEFHA